MCKRQFASDGFCSQGPWPDRVTSDSRSGCCSPGDSRGGKTRAPASRHSTGRKASGTTSRHSELYTAPRQLIGGLSESTDSSGQMRRARRRECLPWYTGVLLGAERLMAPWHKSQEKASRLREVNRSADFWSRQARLYRCGAQAGGSACRGTQGFSWGRRGLWRRGTRAKKRLAGDAR